MSDQRVIDAYLGSHHDQDLSEDMEERILAEAEAEIAVAHGKAPSRATTTEDQGDERV